MKKTIIMFAFFWLLLFVGCAKSSNINIPLSVCTNESYFDDFYIKGEKVYFVCWITVSNSSKDDLSFKIIGDFKEDYEHELINHIRVLGYNSEKEEIFQLNANQKKTYEVFFIDDHAGGSQKQNRLLPEISFEIIGKV